MIDFEKIGTRIAEERKFVKRVSQRKMAEDLNMYQADISNLEKAKNGSGITDLYKLDFIADYLNISVESLIFGRKDDTMEKYYGNTMQLKPINGYVSEKHKEILRELTGEQCDFDPNYSFYACGPYSLYSFPEVQSVMTPDPETRELQPLEQLVRLHNYLFYKDEVAGVMTVALTSVMDHVFQPRLGALQRLIPWDSLDVTDTIRTLNPYWALWYHSSEEEAEEKKYLESIAKRMDQLRQAGEERPIIYIQSVYVRTDYRQHGLFRLFIDYLKTVFDGCILWLNLEPTSGTELSSEYSMYPVYSVSEVGQMNLNAMIAEKLGFTVDPDVWHKDAEAIDDNGNVVIKQVEVRKVAYLLPKEIQEIIKDDGNLVELGRAKQKLKHAAEQSSVLYAENNESGIDFGNSIDFSSGKTDGYYLYMMRIMPESGKYKGRRIFVYAAQSEDETEKYRFGVSSKNPLEYGINHDGQDEQYEWLDDASESEMFEQLCLVNSIMNGILSERENDRIWAIKNEQINEYHEGVKKKEIRNMKRYLIEEAKYGFTRGGIACGPIDPNTVVTVKFNDGEGSKWISVVDVEGILNIFLLDKDYHKELVNEDQDDAFYDYMNDHLLTEFDGVEVGAEYGEIAETLMDNKENPASQFIGYVINLTSCPLEETDRLIEKSVGKYADEIGSSIEILVDRFLEEE